MRPQTQSKKENDAQLSLYRLMRLQNQIRCKGKIIDSKMDIFLSEIVHFAYLFFLFRQFRLQFRVSYQHFPLETLPNKELLKTFWKLVTTHYFKKINNDEQYRLECLNKIFGNKYKKKNQIPTFLQYYSSQGKRFWNQMKDIISQNYLEKMTENIREKREETIWIKSMFLNWMKPVTQMPKKTKKIVKKEKKEKTIQEKKNKKKLIAQLLKEQKELDKELKLMSEREMQLSEQKNSQNDVDEQLQNLQRELMQTQQQNQHFLDKLQINIQKDDEIEEINIEDVNSVQWIVHSLQQKQIAESVSKITKCERWSGESKFTIQFESAMNVLPQEITEYEVKRINNQRQNSLLKFYKTGVKSLYSYICHNFVGIAELQQNRMNLSKNKDKDYLQLMKKNIYANSQIKNGMEQYDMCHHCKFLYPQYMLTTCRFVSDRQSMPKVNQGQSQFNSQLQNGNLNGRISQRVVSKHRNCFTGYAKINDEYICGRKYCKGCIKDNYGKDWFKLNHGLCPFCEAVCHCTRCLRNQKINKLKSFFISLGGNVNQIQEGCLISKLPIKKDQILLKIRPRQKQGTKFREIIPVSTHIEKNKRIQKERVRDHVNYRTFEHQRRNRNNHRRDIFDKNQILEEEVEKTSALTAQKEINTILQGRRQSRRIFARYY